MNKWSYCKLEDICRVVPGGTPNTSILEYWNGGIAWITPKDLSGYNSRYIHNGERNISKLGLENSSAVISPKGSILLSTRAPIGYLAIATANVATNQGMKTLIPKMNTTSSFLYYLVKYYIPQMKQFANGSTFLEISTDSVKNLMVRIPSLIIQKEIAGILSSLDDKIELNNKINKNLEEIAQTLYKRWFVDFEFPNDNGEPYKSSGGEMVESELGFIPKGWKYNKIDEITNLQIGRTPPRKENEWFSYNPLDVKWYSIKDMGTSGIYIDSPSEFLTHEAIKKFNIPIVEENTVLLSFKLTIGRLAITTSKCTTNEAIAHMNKLKENISTNYLYLFLRNINYDSLGNTSSIATAVNSKTIKNIKVLIPDKKTLSKFTYLTGQFFNQIKNLQFQNQKLSNTRDELLPKLMNGKIEVPVEE